MTISIPSVVPSKYSNQNHATAEPSKYSVSHKLHFSKNHFVKSKTRHRLSMAIPTVHDQGHGYSNRLHSAEVVHFTHTIRLIHRDTTTDRHTQVCGVWIIDRSPPSIFLSTGAYPVEFTSPARPDSTSFRVSLRRHGGRTQVSSGRINPEGSRFTIAHKLAATRILESFKPLYSMRLPPLKHIDFRLSPSHTG
jgi:hypothetical protein